MNTPFNISQWLKKQPLMPAPKDDFAAIFQQLNKSKSKQKPMKVWSLAAGIALMAVGIMFFYQQSPSVDNQLNQTALLQLQQQVSQLELQLQASNTVTVSNPGSTQLENQVMLEQWLAHLNSRLASTHNAQQQQNLLQAKLTVLQNLNQENQTIQLI